MKKVYKIVVKVLPFVVLFFNTFMVHKVFGASLQDSILVTGTKSLVDAIISWLMGIGITICGGYFI